MKKIFLPLLAAVGMALGLTLSSCGGGGGVDKGNEPSRAFVDTALTVVSGTPNFRIYFDAANTGWTVASTFRCGPINTYPCFFNLIRDPRKEAGHWVIYGNVGFVGDDILKDSNFRALAGVNKAATSCTLDRFELILYIPAGKQMGDYAGTGQLKIVGAFFPINSSNEATKMDEKPRAISFEMTGSLKEEYLEPFVAEEETKDETPY